MATLKYTDLSKKDTASIVLRRVYTAAFFQLKDKNSPMYRCTKRIQLKLGREKEIFDEKNALTTEKFLKFLKLKTLSDGVEIELKMTQRTKRFYKITDLYKDIEFDGKSKVKTSLVGAERQEIGLLAAVKDAALRGVKLPGVNLQVMDAWKNDKRTVTGQEPYIDIVIQDTNAKKYGISCKGDFAPSLGGGGLAGLSRIVPRLVDSVYTNVEEYLKEELGIDENQTVPANYVPDIFIPISTSHMRKILIGNEYIGGPVDYMYVGKMDVSYSFSGNRLDLNGKFYDIDDYMRKIGKFYFRIRKRELQGIDKIKVTYKEKNKDGYPILFKHAVTNKPNFRLVIDSRYSGNSKVLKEI